jgi:hypothetical protein
MSDPSAAILFSSPLQAFCISVVMVAGFGYVFYRLGTRSKPPAAASHWPLLALVAEVCVAVGLIGLATFAGRMKIGADHQHLQQQVQRSQSALGASLRQAVVHNCAPAGRRAQAPFSPAVASKDLCAIASAHTGLYAAEADWDLAESSLREFAVKYPGCIPNVFTRHSDCDATVEEAIRIAAQIRALQQHRRAYEQAVSAMPAAPDGWGLLLLAFFVAAIGIAIKCARAASEFIRTAKSGGQ